MIYYHVQHFGDHSWVPWLLRLLDAPGTTLHVSYDGPEAALAELQASCASLSLASKRLEVCRSRRIRWCGPSQAANTIAALSEALRVPDWEFFINLSGQCFPLRSQAEIGAALKHSLSSTERLFFNHFAVPTPPTILDHRPGDELEAGSLGRIAIRAPKKVLKLFEDPETFPICRPHNRVYLHCQEPDTDEDTLIVRGLDEAERAFRLAYFAANPHICGRAWYVIHRSACEACVAFFESPAARDGLQIFLNCFEPDESFLPTMLLGAKVFAPEALSRKSFRLNYGAPAALTDADLEQIKASDAFFGRKLFHGHSPALVGYIEQRVLGRSAIEGG